MSCSVAGCSNNHKKTSELGLDVKYFGFPSRPYHAERKETWIRFCRRKNLDGSKWVPGKSSRVCSLHFHNNMKREEENHPSYNPSIFKPSQHPKNKDSRAISRFNRWLSRRRKTVQTLSYTNELESEHEVKLEADQVLDNAEQVESKSSGVTSQEPKDHANEEMSQLPSEKCIWCGKKSLTVSTMNVEKQIRLLLNLVGLSASSVLPEEEEACLCTNCIDLIQTAEDYRQRLDEAKLTLKNQVAAKTILTGARAESNCPKLVLGERVAKCFSKCEVRLESINVKQGTFCVNETRTFNQVRISDPLSDTELTEPSLDVDTDIKMEVDLESELDEATEDIL